MPAQLEHANVTVSDARKTAAWICGLFDWHIRWEGPAKDGGHSIHVGTETQYLALYQPARDLEKGASTYTQQGGLNHIGVVVDDIDAMEHAVKAAGFAPENHDDYEPGKRFYFRDRDGIEFEIVAYG